jgi:hypothetical protein
LSINAGCYGNISSNTLIPRPEIDASQITVHSDNGSEALRVIPGLSFFGKVQADVGSDHFVTKSYAVFVARYNINNTEVLGGVAGTAFFISPTKAITAFHVLQNKSFALSSISERVRVWLVHEGRSAIELNQENLQEHKDLDLTVINFNSIKMVGDRDIYPLAKAIPAYAPFMLTLEVESNGFIEGSTGPVLFRNGPDLFLMAVPNLQRIKTRGHLLRFATFYLTSADVTLKNALCLQVSYVPILGLSGGPVLINGQVVGMNLFSDVSKKSSWALSLAGFRGIFEL